jgi:hypothetical protein
MSTGEGECVAWQPFISAGGMRQAFLDKQTSSRNREERFSGQPVSSRKHGRTLMGTILIIILILLLVGALPSWPYSSGWGYGPSGLLGTVLVVVLILVLLGRV